MGVRFVVGDGGELCSGSGLMADPKPEFRLHRKGVREILRTYFAPIMDETAERVADQVRSIVGDDVDVEVNSYTTDRNAASVVIADVRGVELQARKGALTRAAAQVGLEVKVK